MNRSALIRAYICTKTVTLKATHSKQLIELKPLAGVVIWSTVLVITADYSYLLRSLLLQ